MTRLRWWDSWHNARQILYPTTVLFLGCGVGIFPFEPETSRVVFIQAFGMLYCLIRLDRDARSGKIIP